MTEPVSSRRRFRKKVIRRQDGELFDLTQRRPITIEELREYLRSGGLFEARTRETDRDCTYEVLQKVVAGGLTDGLPGLSGGNLGGLGALGGLAGMVGGGNRTEAVVGLLRLLDGANGRAASYAGWESEGWDGPPRERRRREPLGWAEDEPSDDEWGDE
ncbi:MAG: hypothetical protein ACT4QG_14690 [Sporichthyaceae bacterium]